MKATKIYPVAALLALSLAACNNEEITTTPDARVALQVTGGIQTRAYDATWEANDEIGIFGFTQEDVPAQAYSNVRYVTTGGNGTFTPDGTTIYLPTDGSSLDFLAYYPYTTTAMTDGVYIVNVTDQSDLSASDVQLRAQAVESNLHVQTRRRHDRYRTCRNDGATDQPADPRHFRRDATRR